MERIPRKTWTLTGLLHPGWEVRVGRSGAPARRLAVADGLLIEEERLESLPLESLVHLRHTDLTGARIVRSRMGAVESSRAVGARLEGCSIGRLVLTNLEEATLLETEVEEVVACSLVGARLQGCTLKSLVLADLSGAHLEDVRLGSAPSCDLSGASLVRCQLDGADLRGACLRGARLEDTDLLRCLVAGADLRGVSGIPSAARARLIRNGARFHAGGWMFLLRRLAPGADALRLEFLARLLNAGSWLVGLVCAVAALWGVVHPPPVLPVPEVLPARVHPATAQEIERTQANLARFRQAVVRAREDMLARGAPPDSWPSFADLSQNRYDLDGKGPGEVRAELVPGGLPENYLTDEVGGILPYCNDNPSQETLAGSDVDWQYCDMNGRLMAAAGYSGQPTLRW